MSVLVYYWANELESCVPHSAAGQRRRSEMQVSLENRSARNEQIEGPGREEIDNRLLPSCINSVVERKGCA